MIITIKLTKIIILIIILIKTITQLIIMTILPDRNENIWRLIDNIILIKS